MCILDNSAVGVVFDFLGFAGSTAECTVNDSGAYLLSSVGSSSALAVLDGTSFAATKRFGDDCAKAGR